MGMARPRGTYAPVAQALIAAASVSPGTVRQLAARALVGQQVARYTASRLVSAGALVIVSTDRPAVLAVPAVEAGVQSAQLQAAMAAWCRSRQ